MNKVMNKEECRVAPTPAAESPGEASPKPKRKAPERTPETECVARNLFRIKGSAANGKAALRAAIDEHGIGFVDASMADISGIWASDLLGTFKLGGQPQEQSDPWAKPTHIAQQSPETKAWLAEIEASCKESDRAIALADAAQAAMHATRRAKERPPAPQTVDPSQDEALNG